MDGDTTDDDTEELTQSGEDDAEERAPAARGGGISWHHVQDFDDEDDAQRWLEQGAYSTHRVNYTKKYGFKQYYYCQKCGKPSKNLEQSKASIAAGRDPIGEQIYLQYNNSSTTVSLFSNKGVHVHEEKPALGL
ncbi:hypothetical protein FOZ63_022010, partial [Perkinsus olseni]